MHVGNHHEGPRAAHRTLDVVADQPVARRENQAQHKHAEDAARTTFPNQQNSGKQQQRTEEGISADEGHDCVTDRIDQLQVDEPECLDVQGL